MKHVDAHDLELAHRTLDDEIHKLDRRGAHMTPEDRLRAAELKKQRLAARDRLFAIRTG